MNTLDNSFLYNLGYYILLFIIYLSVIREANRRKVRISKGLIFLILFIIGLYIGLRPLDVGTDTKNYLRGYILSQSQFNDNEYNKFGSDPLFNIVRKGLAQIVSYRFFLIIVEYTILFLIYKSCKLASITDKKSTLLLLLFILSSSCAYNFQTNIIRNGLAIAAIFVYSHYIYNKKPINGIIYLIIGIGCHFSVLLPLVIFLFCRYTNLDIKYYYLFFTICLLMSFYNIGIHTFIGVGDIDFNKANKYLSSIDGTTYKIGFRPTFAIYNTFFLLLFNYIAKSNSFLIYYLKYYTVSSGIFFLFFGIPFSDRIGAFSWLAIPYILYIGLHEASIPRKKLIINISFITYLLISYLISPK